MLDTAICEELRAHTLEYSPEHGGVSYRAICVPPEPGLNWSLANLYSREDAERNPELAARWGTLLKRLGAIRAYAPSVGFMSGEIVCPCALCGSCVPLPPGMCMYRNRNRPAEGTTIEPKEAVNMATGGCAAVVVTGCGTCIVSHAGRASAMDMRDFGGESYPREHFSIIDKLVQVVDNLGHDPRDFRVDVLFALPRDDFAHPLNDPVYGEVNRAMRDYLELYGPAVYEVRDEVLYLDLGALIVAQALEAKFGHASAKCELTRHHATTRHPDPAMRDQRNAVVVVRTA